MEIIANPLSRKKIQSFSADIQTQILETIKRRPSTDTDLCQILGLHKNELNKYLSTLLESGEIESLEMDRGTFFRIRE